MASSPEHKLAEKARKAFKTNYQRILQDQKGGNDLAAYESKLSAISLNKSVMYGLTPIFLIA